MPETDPYKYCEHPEDQHRSESQIWSKVGYVWAAGALVINAPAIDANGTMYANSEDGNVYAIGPDSQERDHLLLDTALGASYTPVALDREGRVYALNAGHLYVVGANRARPGRAEWGRTRVWSPRHCATISRD